MSADPLRAAAREGRPRLPHPRRPRAGRRRARPRLGAGRAATRCWCGAGDRTSGAWPAPSPTTSASSTSTATTWRRATAGRCRRSCRSTPGVLATRPAMAAVVHAHPPSVARRAAWPGCRCGRSSAPTTSPPCASPLGGVPVYGRSVLIARAELADEMLAAMGDRPVCILRGHGITVAGESVEQAVVTGRRPRRAVRGDGAAGRSSASTAPEVPEADRAELPDLGGAFNDQLHWQALAADLDSRTDRADTCAHG